MAAAPFCLYACLLMGEKRDLVQEPKPK
jgi:hypothetical protein